MWSYVISFLSGIVGVTYVPLPECTMNKARRQQGGRNPQKGRSQTAAGINRNVPIKQLELSRLSALSLAQDHF